MRFCVLFIIVFGITPTFILFDRFHQGLGQNSFMMIKKLKLQTEIIQKNR
jgi:hypothetical protein